MDDTNNSGMPILINNGTAIRLSARPLAWTKLSLAQMISDASFQKNQWGLWDMSLWWAACVILMAFYMKTMKSSWVIRKNVVYEIWKWAALVWTKFLFDRWKKVNKISIHQGTTHILHKCSLMAHQHLVQEHQINHLQSQEHPPHNDVVAPSA